MTVAGPRPGAWLRSWVAPGSPGPLLVCLPQAGAGCGQFRAWQQPLAGRAVVVGVQLPGREQRWTEPPVTDLDAAADAVAGELLPLLRGRSGTGSAARRFVVYGHSLGGLLGFEVVRRLESSGHPAASLVVAACRPPEHWTGAGRGIVDADDDLDALLSARGLSADDLDEDSRREVLDLVRADARLTLGYRGDRVGRLATPIEAWGGLADATVTAEQLDGWAAHACGGFARRTFGGGHYFHSDHGGVVLEILAEMLGSAPLGSARLGSAEDLAQTLAHGSTDGKDPRCPRP